MTGVINTDDDFETGNILPFAVRKRPAEPVMGTDESGRMQEFRAPRASFVVPGAVSGLINAGRNVATTPGDVYSGKYKYDQLPEKAVQWTWDLMGVNPFTGGLESGAMGVAQPFSNVGTKQALKRVFGPETDLRTARIASLAREDAMRALARKSASIHRSEGASESYQKVAHDLNAESMIQAIIEDNHGELRYGGFDPSKTLYMYNHHDVSKATAALKAQIHPDHAELEFLGSTEPGESLRLMAALREELLNRGITKVRGTSLPGAKPLYERLGAVPISDKGGSLPQMEIDLTNIGRKKE